MLSKNAKKLLFFWVIFNFVGYFTYLTNTHPYFTVSAKNNLYINYFLTPSCDKFTEKDNFFPFHDFYQTSYGNGSNGGFTGVYGYYGHYEFLLYVVLPLFGIAVVWVYRRFIA